MKITISIDDELLIKVDEYVKKNYMTRSGLIAMCLSQHLNNQELIEGIKTLSKALSDISLSKSLTEEELKKIEDLDVIVKYMSNTIK